ncbi:MAG: hypothetical protein DDT23_00046 [candidate division WS2 bacterium]|nr:hypothetical protein [Candidatus Lithacetigena glycinireducens]
MKEFKTLMRVGDQYYQVLDHTGIAELIKINPVELYSVLRFYLKGDKFGFPLSWDEERDKGEKISRKIIISYLHDRWSSERVYQITVSSYDESGHLEATELVKFTLNGIYELFKSFLERSCRR